MEDPPNRFNGWHGAWEREYVQSFVGELFGTFLLVFFGCSTVAVTVLFAAHVGLFQVAMVWGIGVALAIYSTRHLSCAHLNPAVSLAMVLAGRMVFRKLPYYWAAQVLGAFLAGLVLYGTFGGSIAKFEAVHHILRGSPDSIRTAMMFGEYFPNPSAPANTIAVSLLTAFASEALGTFLLVTTIFLLTEGCNVGRPPSDIAPILIGLTVTAIISILAPLTQCGINPARDFGPRLVAFWAGWKTIAIPGPRDGFFTVYILGPLVGGAVSAAAFTLILQPLLEAKASSCRCDLNVSSGQEDCVLEMAAEHRQQEAGRMTKQVKILVFGTTPPCAKCLQAEKEARRAAERFAPGQVIVEKLDALSATGQKHGIFLTPTVIVEGERIAGGKLVYENQLVELIEKLLKE